MRKFVRLKLKWLLALIRPSFFSSVNFIYIKHYILNKNIEMDDSSLIYA